MYVDDRNVLRRWGEINVNANVEGIRDKNDKSFIVFNKVGDYLVAIGKIA